MLAAWMLYALVVSLLAALAALVLERAVRPLGRSARWIWGGALLLALALLAVPWIPGGSQDGDALSEAPGGEAAEAPDGVLAWTIEVPSGGALDRLERPLAWGWAGSTGLLLLWVGGAHLVLRRRARRWERSRVGDEDVLVSRRTGPALIGAFRVRLVLPRWCLELPDGARELVLAHEEEHRRAGDTTLVSGAFAVALLLPWNLPLWWMLRRLRAAVELDCDARVMRRFPQRRRLYGELLLLVCARSGATSGALATFSERRSTLARRIHMLTRPSDPGSRRRAVLLAVLGALLVVGACLVPGPDRDVDSLTGPEVEAEATADLMAEPTFTPYEVAPEVRNRREVVEALGREYPSILRDAGIGGVVLVHFFIDEEGIVQNARVAQGSGYDALDAAALRVAHEFRFSAAMNRDETVPVWVQIPIRFAAE